MGVDLTGMHKDEIAGHSSVWAWVKARIQTANFAGMRIGDYIPLTLSDGKAFKAEVAGIDTYHGYGGYSAVGHHIDFISRDRHPDAHVWNKVNYNNGTTVSSHPWLASDLNAWLNGLQAQVPNAATANPALVAVDYQTTGVYPKLPAALKAVIATKAIFLPTRYLSGELLSADNGSAWEEIGPLWIPSEIEVYGCEHFGSKNGHSSGGFQQYPIFAQNMRRVKGAGDGGARAAWWLLSASGGSSVNCAAVSGTGAGVGYLATYAACCVPLCFRIA